MKKDKEQKNETSLPLPHYVCTGGCLTVSDKPGKCYTPSCPRARNNLAECRCTDGKHGDLLYKNATRVAR